MMEMTNKIVTFDITLDNHLNILIQCSEYILSFVEQPVQGTELSAEH